MPITGGFGFMLDTKTGLRRRWYICRETGVKRWADNDQPCNANKETK